MQTTLKEARLIRRVHWLIRLRWIAIGGLCVGTYVAHSLWSVIQTDRALYGIALLLALENILSLYFLKWLVRPEAMETSAWIRRLMHFQIGTDLVLLTVLVHFSGGVENPLIMWFVFHMVIASILLSARESYLQAALAVALLVTLATLEYRSLVAHYCLNGLLTHGFHADGTYVFSIVGVLAGTIFLVVYMTTDISSQLRRQEEAYRRANEALQEKDRIKNEYVARVTHDIKGHLAAIQSCHHVVLGESLGPLTVGQRDFMDRSCKRTTYLNNFVRTLLRLTELRLSKRLEAAVVPLNDVIEQAVSACESRAKEHGVTLTHRVELTDLEVRGNGVAIEEAICNLLLNGIKYTPSPGRIDLVARVEGDYVMVTVSDSGIGIPEAELARVFEEFYRASNARQVEKDGTGLGLSIVKQIIERHGGRIWVESREGAGTIVTFTLPLDESPGVKRAEVRTPTIREFAARSKDYRQSEVH